MRKMAIMGPADAVAKAKALVNAQIEYAETSAVLEQSQTVQIPANQTGLVIGKGGATIRDIEAETGATVNIETRQVCGRPCLRVHATALVRAAALQRSRTARSRAWGARGGAASWARRPAASLSARTCACVHVCAGMSHDGGARESQKPATGRRAHGRARVRQQGGYRAGRRSHPRYHC